MGFDAANGDDIGDRASSHSRATHRSLRLIADSLGMSVASFYEDAQRTASDPRTETSEAQQVARDSAELLHGFMSLSDPKDRQVCIAFVQTIVAKRASS